MLKSKQTKRKFYNKWLYKITLNIPGIYAFRYLGLAKDDEQLTSSELFQRVGPYIASSTRLKLQQNQSSIVNLSNSLQGYDPKEWGMRVEGDCVDLYTNNKDIFDMLSKKFSKQTTRRFEPQADTIDLLDTGVYVAKKYPFDQYKYKVFLLPHKFDRDKKKKQDYIKWLETQGDKVRMTDTTKDWFKTWNYNWDRRYMYVEDDKTLLLIKLRNPEALGKVYKYVVADK